MKLIERLPEALTLKIESALENARTEIEQSENLKWGFAVAGLVLYLSLLMFVDEQSIKARAEYIGAKNQISRLKAQVVETGWDKRANEANALVNSLDRRFWPGETTGLAEASFERWIRQVLEQHGTEVRQVQLTRSPVLEGESNLGQVPLSSVQRIRAKVIAPLEEAALIRFLDDAATNSTWVIVEQLIIRAGRNPRFEMDLATFMKSSEPAQ